MATIGSAPEVPSITPGNPSTTAYACGVSLARDAGAATAELAASYSAWKAALVTSSGAGGYLRVDGGPGYKNGTVSEGIGYGMLLAAYLDDRATFDGLWEYAKSHRNSRGLMAWYIRADNTVVDRNAATDGDQDMAFALIVADARWGGYRPDALALIASLRRHTVDAKTYLPLPDDVPSGDMEAAYLNPSYFAPAYYKAFAAYTGDSSWTRVADKSYEVIANIHARSAAGQTGLLPEWSDAAGGVAYRWWESGKPAADYHYGYNSIRAPWRLAKDAAWNCDSRARQGLDKLNAFFRGVAAANILDGYTLEGRVLDGGTRYHTVAFIGPAMAGALTSADEAYRQSLWNRTVRLRESTYYASSLRLLSLLLASGNMPSPVPAR